MLFIGISGVGLFYNMEFIGVIFCLILKLIIEVFEVVLIEDI